MKQYTVIDLLEFTDKHTDLDYAEVCDTMLHCFSFGDADDTLVSPGRLCAALGIEVPATLPAGVMIGLGS